MAGWVERERAGVLAQARKVLGPDVVVVAAAAGIIGANPIFVLLASSVSVGVLSADLSIVTGGPFVGLFWLANVAVFALPKAALAITPTHAVVLRSSWRGRPTEVLARLPLHAVTAAGKSLGQRRVRVGGTRLFVPKKLHERLAAAARAQAPTTYGGV